MHRRAFIAAALTAPVLFAGGDVRANENSEKKKGGGKDYIQIETLTATIRKPDGRRGVLTVETGVDAPDRSLRNLADASTPRLRAAYAQALMSYASTLSPGAVPNADYLAREFQRQTDLVLGRPGARLLLGTILVN